MVGEESLACGDRQARKGLASRMFHDTGFINLPFTVFDVGTFVVLFLTFRHADFDFAPGVLPIEGEGDDGVTFTVDAAVQIVQLALIQ